MQQVKRRGVRFAEMAFLIATSIVRRSKNPNPLLWQYMWVRIKSSSAILELAFNCRFCAFNAHPY